MYVSPFGTATSAMDALGSAASTPHRFSHLLIFRYDWRICGVQALLDSGECLLGWCIYFIFTENYTDWLPEKSTSIECNFGNFSPRKFQCLIYLFERFLFSESGFITPFIRSSWVNCEWHFSPFISTTPLFLIQLTFGVEGECSVRIETISRTVISHIKLLKVVFVGRILGNHYRWPLFRPDLAQSFAFTLFLLQATLKSKSLML